ncbi:MAG: GNAT family N-acetyltransferase [Chloroflexi bacterium]|nr:GNAT family N-acetyltransferase [Chloroflexota bacterium]
MTQAEAFLTRPQELYKSSFIEAVYEYIREKRTVNWHPEILRERFDEYLRVLQQAETDPLAGMVPATQLWLVAAGHGYIGDVDVRHRLTLSLQRYGGHIGYKIRPSCRRQGYGTLICRLGIEQARQLGIGDILITCDDDNRGSAKIIEANGGVLQDRIDNGRGVLTRRYWVHARV